MMLLFPRYEPGGIGEYYAGDFTSDQAGSKPVMWVNELGDQVLGSPFQYAEVLGGGVEMGGAIMWQGMGKACFEGIIGEVSGQFKPENFKHRPFALGTIFAPPKSISLAALAGPRVERVIIEAHRMAVGFVAGLLARMLVTRKQGEDVPIRARVLRFTHPFSRAEDPQLHDHLEWVPDPRDGALHTYPWFFFQHAVRQIYHFCLAAELARQGFGIDISDPEELRWELSGVDRNEVMLFSKRSAEVEALARAGCRESLPQALRWAALTSSKALPKFPGLALGTARDNWEAECPRDRCSVSRGEPRERQPLAIPELRSLFRKSSSANLLTVQGRALALCLGQTCEAGEAMRAVDNNLLLQASAGRVLMSKVRSSRAFLSPECFRQEQEILALVRGRVGRGRALTVPDFLGEGEENFQKALAVRNQIRIVSTSDALPEDLEITHVLPPEKGTPPARFVRAGAWDANGILKEMAGKTAGDLVVAVPRPARNGDFLSVAQAVSLFRGFDAPNPAQRNFTLRKGKGSNGTVTTVEVRSRALPLDPKVPWMELENRPTDQGAVCVVPAGYPEAVRRDMNMEMARRLVLSRPLEEASPLIKVDLVVPWQDAQAGMELVVFKSHLKFQRFTRWKILEVFADGSMKLAKKRASRTLASSEIRRLKGFLSVVDGRQIRVVPGMRLQVETSFSQLKPVKLSLKQGEIVTALRLGDDGSLVLADGREIPAAFRAFSPAFLLRELPSKDKGRKVVLAGAPGEGVSKREWALGFRSPKLIVFTPEPGKLAEEFGCEDGLYHAQQSLRKTLRFVSGEGEFVPPDSRWSKLLALQKLSVPGTQIPGQMKLQAIADGGEVESPVMTETPECRPKKKIEDEAKPPQQKRREEQEPPVSGGGVPVLPKRSRKAAGPTREDDAAKK